MNKPLPEGVAEKLADAYDRMLERTRETMKKADKDLHQAVETARERATELGELTREEAELVSIYVVRDLEDAATFIDKSGKELRDWLRFDLEVVEDTVLQIFSQMVDHTRVALDQLQQRANAVGEWHTGEIAGIGTLQCKSCGEMLHFHHTGHIPPCPKCHGTKFRRISTSEE
ncbi:MAG: zinc ribbon-containing protein [Pseudomonadota bacterium]